MGNRMTFVTEEEGINVFLKSKKVDFELAVQNIVYCTASIPKNVFLALHEKLYIMLKGKMGTVNLHQFTGQLTEELHEQLENLGTHGTMDLNNLVRHLLYPVTVNMLFNKSLFPTNKKKIKEFHQYFQAYDEDFEYGSQLPECLLRNWSKSKKWFLELFEKNIPDIKACKSAKDNSMTLLQATLDIVETETSKENSPNYGLLLLWASLSNAVPAAFWTLAYVLSHPDIHKAIMEGISSVFGKAGKDKIEVSEDDLEKLLLIKWCVLETIRLKAPGVITRKVVKPVEILNYIIPSGDLLMLSPFWLHRNPKYFPEPELFKPERWKKANLENHSFLDCFMAFGSGKFQCPASYLRDFSPLPGERVDGHPPWRKCFPGVSAGEGKHDAMQVSLWRRWQLEHQWYGFGFFPQLRSQLHRVQSCHLTNFVTSDKSLTSGCITFLLIVLPS
ncbi:24-hydroxycholesterol 7-alpha-hydroxylase isoform X4 [Pongo abelii]